MQVYKYAMYTSMQYVIMQICNYANIQFMQLGKYGRMEVSKYTSMQVCKYGRIEVSNYAINGSMQLCSYAMQVCKYARLQVCKYVSMQVCQNAGKNSYQILVCSYRLTQGELERGSAQSNLLCLESILKQTFCLGLNFSLQSKSWPKAEDYIHCGIHHPPTYPPKTFGMVLDLVRD